jgi:hypothetical protein
MMVRIAQERPVGERSLDANAQGGFEIHGAAGVSNDSTAVNRRRGG